MRLKTALDLLLYELEYSGTLSRKSVRISPSLKNAVIDYANKHGLISIDRTFISITKAGLEYIKNQ